MPDQTSGQDAAATPSAIWSADGPEFPVALPGKPDYAAVRIFHNDPALQLVLLGFLLLWYGALLGISWRMWWPVPSWNLTFNSMLDHLLHGRFDVAPEIVGGEGFLRNGHVYSYFGVWCAFLRLPLWFAHRMNIDVTLWSCLAAACLAAMAKIRALLLIRRRSLASPMTDLAVGLTLAYVVFGGSGVGVLGVSLVQEVTLWAYAWAAVFVYLALKGLVEQQFDSLTLSGMGLCAGLALLTRVSTGVGLIGAFCLLLGVIATQSRQRGEANQARTGALRLGSVKQRILAPLGILSAFIAATGVVNYFRWGNPTTFANYDLYLLRDYFPGFVRTMHAYGPFNLVRIPFSLAYYFFPIWVLHAPGGHLFLGSTRVQYFGDVELPPSSFFLTDLLPFCFIVLAAVWLWRRRSQPIAPTTIYATALSVGLLVPWILMFTLDWQAYRYRIEFYPEIDFLAFLALYIIVTDKEALASFARWRRWLAAGLALSIMASLLAFSLDVLSGDGLPDEILRPGIAQYYLQQASRHYDHLKRDLALRRQRR